MLSQGRRFLETSKSGLMRYLKGNTKSIRALAILIRASPCQGKNSLNFLVSISLSSSSLFRESLPPEKTRREGASWQGGAGLQSSAASGGVAAGES